MASHERERGSSDRLRRLLANPLHDPKRSVASRLVQWLAAAAVMLIVFGWISWKALTEAPEPERPPPDPRLFELVPADYMTPSEGVVRAPTLRAADGDRALLAGRPEEAASAYREAWRSDARDRYAAFLAACVALELCDFEGAKEPLRAAAAPEPPSRSPFASVRRVARILELNERRPEEPLADLYLRAVAHEVRASDERPAGGPDPLRDLYVRRLLAERAAPPDPARLPAERQELLALVAGEASLDLARAMGAAGPLAVQLAALTLLRKRAGDEEAGRIADALQRLSEAEPDNAYYELARAGILASEAFTAPALPGEPPALATEDEPERLPGLPSEALAALEEASLRARCDPHLRELLELEESLRREAGDRFAPLHLRPARDWLFLGDPGLAARITYRALVAERAHAAHEGAALLQAAVALAGFAADLAHDPFAVEHPWVHRDRARTLLDRGGELGLDAAQLRARTGGFQPLVRADARWHGVGAELDRPLPVPRLVRELFERYAADRAAVVVTLRRFLDER